VFNKVERLDELGEVGMYKWYKTLAILLSTY